MFVASGLVWLDALAAGPLGGKQAHPVLLVRGRDLNSSPPAGTYLVSRRSPPVRCWRGATRRCCSCTAPT